MHEKRNVEPVSSAAARLLFAAVVCSCAAIGAPSARAQEAEPAPGPVAEATETESTDGPLDPGAALPEQREPEVALAEHVPELDGEGAPAAAPAPVPVDTAEFEQVEPLLQGVPPLRLSLDDGEGDTIPWSDYDAYTEHGPEGLVHFGAQLRIGALFSSSDRVPSGPTIEVAALVDFRFSRRSPWHIRVGVGLSWQQHVQDFLGAGRWVTSSPGALRVRIQPFALDLGRYVSLRLGPSIGAQLVPRANEDGFVAEVFAGGTAEFALRLMDGLLEIGLLGGLQMTGVGDVQRPNASTPPWRTGVIAQPILGGSVGGLLP